MATLLSDHRSTPPRPKKRTFHLLSGADTLCTPYRFPGALLTGRRRPIIFQERGLYRYCLETRDRRPGGERCLRGRPGGGRGRGLDAMMRMSRLTDYGLMLLTHF